MRTLAVLVLALAGCSKLLGITDVTVGDAGGDGAAPPDAAPNTVTGRVFQRCLQVSGAPVVDQATDVSGSIVVALLPDGSPTGYAVRPGTGSADGTFVIHDVPDGMAYLLKIDRSYWVTSAHTIDVHGEVPLRCATAPVPTTAITNLTLAVANMTAFVDDESGAPLSVLDTIEIDAFGLGYQGTAGASSKATTLAATYDWQSGSESSMNSIPLLDQPAGDDLEIFHLRTEGLKDGSGRVARVTHLIDVASPTGLKLQDGVSATVTSMFTPVATSKAVTFIANRGQFDTGFDGYSAYRGLTVQVIAHPILTDVGVGASLASFDLDDWQRAPSLTQAVSNYPYGDPFPVTWKRYQEVAYSRARTYKLPGTTKPVPNAGGLFRNQEYTGTMIVTPALLPPASILVAGTAFGAGGKVAFDGVAPVTVTWNAVGLAKAYTITVSRVTANGVGSNARPVATISTAGTSVKIPAEAFTGGQFFTFRLSAYTTPADYAMGHLLPNGVPSQTAITPSGLFRLSATCGDGTVQPGEDCDTSGESATCDVDCSTRACGDGLLNAAAGEACDTILDTSTCNGATCRLATCGDGYVNAAADEDCDLGAQNGTNGCSGTCKFNNLCGDGVVQSAAEQCDTGGVDSATCNADCTTARCGDGHLNTAAGEACDDGNRTDVDGCDQQCHVVP
jgi:cysteine-rich repeat protein